ncbi:hypothetical protein CXT76_01825 [Candidatus Parvarchaeota archaeon]|jgi:phosphorylcholine metabolism protein LicD|nr:MAG: hypothetical protein CXT76_01825 [Candidatus Parvarchaeota archaeon]
MKKNFKYYQILRDVGEIFEKNKIPIWLEDGTLLGAVRNGDILPGDEKDIDLGIFEPSIRKLKIKKKITKEFSKKGFTIIFFWDVINIIKGDIGVDLILLKRRDNNIFKFRERSDGSKLKEPFRWLHKFSSIEYYGDYFSIRKIFSLKINLIKIISFIPKNFRKFIYNFFSSLSVDNMKPIIYSLEIPKEYILKQNYLNYYGLEFRIPYDVENYLKLNYGDWKTPIQRGEKWDWRDHGDWKKLK